MPLGAIPSQRTRSGTARSSNKKPMSNGSSGRTCARGASATSSEKLETEAVTFARRPYSHSLSVISIPFPCCSFSLLPLLDPTPSLSLAYRASPLSHLARVVVSISLGFLCKTLATSKPRNLAICNREQMSRLAGGRGEASLMHGREGLVDSTGA